jgi:moderate conductance mechanosensitive channel
MFDELGQSTYALFTNGAFWVDVSAVLIKIIVILLLARIVISFLKKLVGRIVGQEKSKFVQMTEQRRNTLQSILNSIVVNVTYFVAAILILAELGFDVTTVLVGAGVIGLAVGFGAQKLVQDVISGFFIIYEDQFSVGDMITTGNYTGTVQDFDLRRTVIKEWTGELHTVPNGHIQEVTNYSRENSTAVVDIGVSYAADIAEVEQVLLNVTKELYAAEEDMIEEPYVVGVQDLGDSEVVLRVAALCQPVTHWAIARKLRRAIKDRFDEKNIDIPYPQLEIHGQVSGPDHSG